MKPRSERLQSWFSSPENAVLLFLLVGFCLNTLVSLGPAVVFMLIMVFVVMTRFPLIRK